MRGASNGQQEPDAGEASRAAALANFGALLLVLALVPLFAAAMLFGGTGQEYIYFRL